MQSHHELFNYHRSLLADTRRTEAFRRAINETVKPGQIVVDLGCGSGILSVLACVAGAKRVYSIERGDVIEVARALAAANGVAERIVFLEGSSRGVVVPERADVLIGEIVGNGGLEENILSFFADAQRRFLAPDGVTIPRTLEIFAAPVCLPDFHARTVGVWKRAYGLDFSVIRPWAAQQTYPIVLREADLRSKPSRVATLDLSRPVSPFVNGRAQFTFADIGEVHGFGVWFSMELVSGLSLTNAPPLATPNWSHLFLPLEVPLKVAVGDVVSLEVSTYDGLVWRWRGEQASAGGRPSERFDHSTFMGFPLRRKDVPLSSATVDPATADRQAVALFVMQASSANATVEAIGNAVFQRFPKAFPTPWAAGQFVNGFVRLLSGE